jgi:hypothetical protein
MTPEFSRILDANVLLQGPEKISLLASAEEREAVAKRLHLVSLHALTADVMVHAPTRTQKCIRLDVTLKAALAQTCVVSLVPVEEKVEESFSLLLSNEPEPEESLQEDSWLDLAQEDAETVYVGDTGLFDVGEIIVQYLSLAMDPYPRHPDAAFTPVVEDTPEKNPFSKLKALGDEDR